MVERTSVTDRSRRHQWLREQPVSLSELPDDLPLTLDEVCEKVFSGKISRATLMAEHRRGTLGICKIGRTYFTTPKDIRMMIEKCRVESPARGHSQNVKRLAEKQRSYDEQAVALAKIEIRRRQLKGKRNMSSRRGNAMRKTKSPSKAPQFSSSYDDEIDELLDILQPDWRQNRDYAIWYALVRLKALLKELDFPMASS